MGEGCEQVTIAVRRLRTATGWPGKAPTIAGLRVPTPLDEEHGFNRCSILDSLERSGESRCYPILEAPEGAVDCVHQLRRPLLSNQERPSLQAPLRNRHPTLRTAALRDPRDQLPDTRPDEPPVMTTRRVAKCSNRGAVTTPPVGNRPCLP